MKSQKQAKYSNHFAYPKTIINNDIDLLNAFQHYIASQKLFAPKESVLLAVSGGIDSMVMCDLFKQANLDFGIAHCNFQLREEDADLDQDFIAAFAKSNHVPFYTIRFDTKELAKQHNKSIQVIARELRYEWLEKIRVAEKFNFIATAHHLNDSIETLLYNLTKGTGIRGLHGIPKKNGFIIRPLLFAERQQIEEYQQKNKIAFREDNSNASTKYSRNKIRHEVIPVLKKINPSLEKTMRGNIKRMQEQEALLNYMVHFAFAKCCTTAKGQTRINVKALLEFPAPSTLLFEWLKDYGFHTDQVTQILEDHHLSGAQFFSKTHRLIVNRAHFILVELKADKALALSIPSIKNSIVLDDLSLSFHLHENAPSRWPADKTIAFLDYEKLVFPLTLRKWQAGDQFQPLGMGGKHKKLQDFFSDLKLSILEKEDLWLLCSAEQIVWVMGYRISEAFKCGEQTSLYLKCSLT